MMKKSIIPLLSYTYLALIRNSENSKLFRNYFAMVEGKKKDIMRNGNLACAIYVSSVLFLVGLIPKVYATAESTAKALRKAGWRPVRNPRVGAVLIWEPKKTGKNTHAHMGFYIGKNKVVSDTTKHGYPIVHHWTFGSTKSKSHRKVKAIYWNKKLE